MVDTYFPRFTMIMVTLHAVNLPLVSMTLTMNLQTVSKTRVSDNDNVPLKSICNRNCFLQNIKKNFSPVTNGVVDTSGAPWVAHFFRKIGIKFDLALKWSSGARRKMSPEKNLISKIFWHCPFNKSAASVFIIDFVDSIHEVCAKNLWFD
jgi:hypothetical protein